MIKRFIKVSFQKEGIHCYPAAATEPLLEGVRFLANEHRHVFHFVVTISVDHNDRDIEFILAKRWMESLYSPGAMDIDFKSCEMLAEELLRAIQSKYGSDRYVKVEVYEDGENGGVVLFMPGEDDA